MSAALGRPEQARTAAREGGGIRMPAENITGLPDRTVAVRDVFGIDSDFTVPAFSTRDEHVPEIDAAYRFNPDVTLAIAAGQPSTSGIVRPIATAQP